MKVIAFLHAILLLATVGGCSSVLRSFLGFCTREREGGYRDNVALGEPLLLNDGTMFTGRQLSNYISAHEFHPDGRLSEVTTIRMDMTPATYIDLDLIGPSSGMTDGAEGCFPVVAQVYLDGRLVFQFRDGSELALRGQFDGDYFRMGHIDGMSEGLTLQTVRAWGFRASLSADGCDPRICGDLTEVPSIRLKMHVRDDEAVLAISRKLEGAPSAEEEKYDLVVVEPSNWTFD